jgi:hypothetical protein
MQMGNDVVAADLLKRATATETDPEVLQQSWYQLGTVSRRLHRMTEAQQAMTTFQKLKDEEAEASQKRLRKFEVRQNEDAARPSTAEPEPNPSQN